MNGEKVANKEKFLVEKTSILHHFFAKDTFSLLFFLATSASAIVIKPEKVTRYSGLVWSGR